MVRRPDERENMIKNINAESFPSYGSVLLERRQRLGAPFRRSRPERTLELDAGERTLFRLGGGRLYLDVQEGMTVLALSHSRSAEGMEFFYLDKPVVLNTGVCFALFPLFDSSSVRSQLEDGASCLPLDVSLPDEPLAISRKLTVPSIYTVFYQTKEKDFFFKGERHPMVELTYVDSGELHSVVEGSELILSPGEMMIYGPNQWHMQYAGSGGRVSFFTLSFELQCPYMSLLFDRKFVLESGQTRLLRQLIREGTEPDGFSNDILIALLEQLLLSVLREENPGAAKERSPASIFNENLIISEVQAYIATHIYDKLSVSLVAAENNISVSHLSALFRRHSGIPLGEYIRRAKLEESKQLIWEGRHNFSQIAKMLHYSSANHFSMQFREHMGMTPSQYAKSARP